MRGMKESRNDFVGKIPCKWEEKPFRVLFDEIVKKNSNGAVTKALKFTYGQIIPKTDFDADTDDYVANTILTYKVVEPNTIMINCLNLNFDFVSQRVGLVKDFGVITSAYLAIKAKNENVVYPQFANYQLKAYDNLKAFHNMGAGVRKTLDFSELGKNTSFYHRSTSSKQLPHTSTSSVERLILSLLTYRLKSTRWKTTKNPSSPKQ